MNSFVVYLIVTMGSHYGITYKGFGGISVTPTNSMEECLALKRIVSSQIRNTTNLRFDDNKIILECR